MSPKIFQVAPTYAEQQDANGSLNDSSVLTLKEFFDMLRHPKVGNMSDVLAAIFTAIARREGEMLDKIGIGVANGSGYVGFFQQNTKTPNTGSRSEDIKKWLDFSNKFYIPYGEDGLLKTKYQESLFGNYNLTAEDKIFRWETLIANCVDHGNDNRNSGSKFGNKDRQEIINEIKILNKNRQEKQAMDLLKQSYPKAPGNGIYTSGNVKYASQFLSPEIRIPANQIWMLKHFLKIGNNFSFDQIRIDAPYDNQSPGTTNVSGKNSRRNNQNYFLLNWNALGDIPKWTSGVSVGNAYQVLSKSKDGSYTDAEIKKLFEDFSKYLNSDEKSVLRPWLSGLGMGINI